MNQKILIGLGILLFAVIIVQSILLFRMSGQVNQINEQTSASSKLPDESITNSSPQTAPAPDPQFFWDKGGWNPFEEMQRMQNEMNKIFGDMRSQLHQRPDFNNMTTPFSFSPSMDVKEEKDKIIVTADIPGSDKSNINVKLEDDVLTISATTQKSTDGKNGKNMFRSERFIGKFGRSIALPAPVQAEKMTTNYVDGVLTITLPKA